MKYINLLCLSFSLFFISCTPDYKTTHAIITALEPNYKEAGNFRASIEYTVDSTIYTDDFEIHLMKLVEDSLITPAPGIAFDIQYNPDNPKQNKIDFNVKAKYAESD